MSWNKGLTKKLDSRLDYYRPTIFKKGRVSPYKGIHTGNKCASGKRSEEFRKLCSERMKKRLQNKEMLLKYREAIKIAQEVSRGKKRPQHIKDKIRKTILEQRGNSDKEYGAEFDSSLKEQVRFRDKYKCEVCGCSQLENGKQLDIHHIDYDKKNNILNNLIALCHSCHTKTNFNREYWKYHLLEVLVREGDIIGLVVEGDKDG